MGQVPEGNQKINQNNWVNQVKMSAEDFFSNIEARFEESAIK